MYQTFIGLEIHIHLLTETKAFCGCRAAYGDEPNTNICPVCMGFPGVLPTLNEEAIKMAYLVARSLSCELAPKTMFDRKNYFYPDMPKNYQISQFHAPVGRHGFFEIEVAGQKKRIGIHDVHLEEDAGKMIHQGGDSLLDLNRAGTSLLEIVTEPDLTSGEEAEIFIQSFRRLVRYLGVCDGNMEEGSLRADANVSINNPGQGLGTKTEVKNMNSSKFARKALQYEINRQARLLDKGETVIQETRLWDEAKSATASMRTKESAHDYRYFPEPDLPPFRPDDLFMDEVAVRLVELPLARKDRLIESYDLKDDMAEFIIDEKETADYFEQLVSLGGDARKSANWMSGHLQSQLKRANKRLSETPLSPQRLLKLIDLVDQGQLNANHAKEVLEALLQQDREPEAIIEELGFGQQTDDSEVASFVEQVMTENPNVLEQIKSGNMKPIGFLVGQVMKLSKGQANPKLVQKIIKDKLG